MNDGHDPLDSELERLIRGCPEPERLSDERRQAIWQVMAARLEQTSDPGRKGQTTASPSKSSAATHHPSRFLRRWRGWGGLSLATAAGLILLAFALRSRPGLHLDAHSGTAASGKTAGPVAHVEIARGECFGWTDGSRRALSADTPLRAGDTVQAGADSWVKLATADGSHLWLCPSTELVVLGPRCSEKPVLKLVRGEIRAEVAHDETKRFGVQTPAGDLQVLGTEFHCRVFPTVDYSQEVSTLQGSQSKLTRTVPSAMLLTVLSGAVSVRTAQGAEVVHGGQRALTVGDSTSTQNVEQMEYIRKWLNRPGEEGSPEVLSLVGVREHLITGMWAVDPKTGDLRHITDLLSGYVRVIKRFGPDLALMHRPGVLFVRVGDQPIGGSGWQLVNDAPVLVNLRTGAKFELTALEGYSAGYCELSPDRRKLAFTGCREKDPSPASGVPECGLYVLDMETLKISLLLPGDLKTTPHWSPDSRWLAVSTANGYDDRQLQAPLALVDTLSGKVVETGINGANAAFTPDGKQIVCCSGFKTGSWWEDGVPIWGNLFIFTVPDGKPRQLTHLPKGGAVEPAFSPDGAYLAYWEYPLDESATRTLHIVDMKTERDTPVTKLERSEVEWLSPTALSLAPIMLGDRPKDLKIVELKGQEWASRPVILKQVQPTPEQTQATAALAEKLFSVFLTYRDAVDACDLHEIDQAQANFKKTRDTLLEIQKELPSDSGAGAGSPGGLALTQQDLAPYIKEFSREADMTANQRINAIVRGRLNWAIPTLLGMYLQEEQKMPESMDVLAKHALAEHWVRGTARAQRREFLVPGDSSEKTTASYQIVSRDDAAGTLVVESDALPDGKKLRTTYKKEISRDGKQVSFKPSVITEEAK